MENLSWGILIKIFAMKPENYLTAGLLDIVFEGRNKNYGAYDLRVNYQNRLFKAISFTVALAALLVCLSVWAKKNKDSDKVFQIKEVKYGGVKTEIFLPPPPPPPPPTKATAAEINRIKFTKPVITTEDVTEVIEEITNETAISTETVKTDVIKQIVAAPIKEIESGIIEMPALQQDETEKVLFSVEEEAEFPGGMTAWKKFLLKNLNAELPVENGAVSGQYTIIVKFIVSKEGLISEVKAENDPGFGMAAEAERVIRSGPRWLPAFHHDRNVNAYKRQPITFVVQEQ